MNHTGIKKTPQNLSAFLHIFFTKFPQTKSILPFLHIELQFLLKTQTPSGSTTPYTYYKVPLIIERHQLQHFLQFFSKQLKILVINNKIIK
jgi:hypothetical protein